LLSSIIITYSLQNVGDSRIGTSGIIVIYIGRVYSVFSYKISYSVATSIYDNFIYEFTIICVYVYDSLVTITHGDIYHNVIVYHLVWSYLVN